MRKLWEFMKKVGGAMKRAYSSLRQSQRWSSIVLVFSIRFFVVGNGLLLLSFLCFIFGGPMFFLMYLGGWTLFFSLILVLLGLFVRPVEWFLFINDAPGRTHDPDALIGMLGDRFFVLYLFGVLFAVLGVCIFLKGIVPVAAGCFGAAFVSWTGAYRFDQRAALMWNDVQARRELYGGSLSLPDANEEGV